MYRFSYEKKKKKKHPKTTNIFIQTEKKKRKENLFLIYPDISIDRRDTRTQSFHSCWAGAAVMNGSPLAYIFFLEARTVSSAARLEFEIGQWEAGREQGRGRTIKNYHSLRTMISRQPKVVSG